MKKRPDESERQYIWRLATAMENGQLNMNWTLLAGVLNEELHDDAPLAESTYRKSYQAAKAYYDEVFIPMMETGGPVADIKVQTLELEKARVKMRDERNEIARIQRDLARRESFVDVVREGMRYEVEPFDGYIPHVQPNGDCDIVVHLTDLHTGIEISNMFNEYNVGVLRGRLVDYLEKIREIQNRHNAEQCYVLLGGDIVSGLIHTNLRLENNLDVVRQVKVAAIAISEFLCGLSPIFSNVVVYSVPGNHGRVQPKKEDNLRGENFDLFIPFILDLMMQEYGNVVIMQHNDEETVARFVVRDQLVYGVHGDKDSMDNVVQKLTLMFDARPDIVLAGHRHTNAMRTIYDVKVYESGCISGPDSYCMDHRLRNKPEQTVLVVNERGVDCAYNVVF